ncbi:MAG: hypothetical protein FD135_2295 [Comamonadaceae bacterium]|nr:MAG: hypothetical protein FD135_2295 [Comamonadaceae bacterium]
MLVQKLRLKRGWSQQQLAELSGLSARTVQRIESGQSASTDTLKSLASVFEIDFSGLTNESSMSEKTSSAVEEQLAFRQVRRVKGFYLHLIKYIAVIAVLFLINFIATPHKIWAMWPALGWGVGVLIHAATVFEWTLFLGAEWEKKQVEKRLGRPL